MPHQEHTTLKAQPAIRRPRSWFRVVLYFFVFACSGGCLARPGEAAVPGGEFSGPFQIAPLPDAQASDTLRQEQVVVVGSGVNHAPYAFLNPQGEPDGFSIELLRAVAEAMDLDLEIQTGLWAVR